MMYSMSRHLYLIGAALVMTLISCATSEEKKEENVSQVLAQETPVVDVKVLRRGDFAYETISNGKVEAARRADLNFSASEVVTKIYAVNGQTVKKGQKIAQIDDYKLKETIQPRCSGGIDFYKDGQKILGVDIGWHDISYGTTMMELDIGSIRTFEVERMLADKITAILSRKRFRRPKDIYDLYCISNCLSFDASKVAEYILNRTEGVGAEWGNFPFSDTVLKEYEKAYNSLTLTSIHKNRVLERPLFMKVYERFCVIAWKVKEPTYEIYWSKERKCFVYDR